MNPWSILALALGLAVLAFRIAEGDNRPLTFAIALLVAIAAGQVAADAGVSLVYTPSVPVGLYLRREIDVGEPVAGQYVCIKPTSPAAPEVLRAGVRDGWLPAAWRAERLIKRVAGVAGDQVSYRPGVGVEVNATLLPMSVARSADSAGRALPSPTYPRSLAEHELWVRSEHPDGFDSRYFGPVDRRSLSCVAEPVWTW